MSKRRRMSRMPRAQLAPKGRKPIFFRATPVLRVEILDDDGELSAWLRSERIEMIDMMQHPDGRTIYCFAASIGVRVRRFLEERGEAFGDPSATTRHDWGLEYGSDQ